MPVLFFAALLVGCPPGGDDDDDAGASVASVTFLIDGVDYASDVGGGGRRASTGFMSVSFQDDEANGSAGAIRGSIGVWSGYAGAGSYGPLGFEMRDFQGINVTVRNDDGSETGWVGNSDATDGSIEVTSDDGFAVEGTFSFTGELWDNSATKTAITGTFSANAPDQDDEN